MAETLREFFRLYWPVIPGFILLICTWGSLLL